MPTESLILRRVYPVPVTFADLRRAAMLPFPFTLQYTTARAKKVRRNKWHAALKESTGALDEVYAVIDGHEVRVAIIEDQGGNRRSVGPSVRANEIEALLIKADEAGYWERPHEVVHVVEERPVSRAVVARACGVTPDKVRM